ncbi:small GTP-binding protein [Paenibacillus phyllosphaerae]|uniref:Small GTP-binding protein n=1 Tax=Paenibacillus phyllosphaerae TaxID=274593 RepID=A0A7W5AX67_9BACL|nr:dynamin family protein [Paenibacillus phyllosphaerae]MBB3110435.1 small GTP-binding protein [Paenibacillus phyllosphaerae]
MSNRVAQSDASPMLAALEQMAQTMADAGDQQHAQRLQELEAKLADRKLAIAFCGHFSAGKSTLVNRICGTNLLPSSPIPTSANVVTIRGGDAKAMVTRLHNGTKEKATVPLDQLDDYCKDGEAILSVELSYPIPTLGDHTILLDTPGIDSTDDAHRMSTESALHLADVVFYVMDYNHVMSEINFTFAKQLKEWGKPLYLIVNQIDKHRERELSFEEYRRSVEEGFANWHLEPSGIIYLSLRQPDHHYSEWEKLLQLFADLRPLREPLAGGSVFDSARHLVREHMKLLDEQSASKREALLEAAGGEEAADALQAEIAQLQLQLQEGMAQKEQYRTKLLSDITSLLDSAIVTPAATRDLAHSFLESRKPGFKMGLLFAGAKTTAEQERRLTLFREDLSARIEASIVWHLKDLLRKAADANGYRGEELEQELDHMFQWQVDHSWIIDHVNTGAVFGNEYTMTYCHGVAADLKSHYKKQVLPWVDEQAARATVRLDEKLEPIRQRLNELAGQTGALQELNRMNDSAKAHEAQLIQQLPARPPAVILPRPEPSASREPLKETAPEAAIQSVDEALVAQATESVFTNEDAEHALDDGALAPQRKAAQRLLQAADLLAPHDMLAAAVAGMREKAERLSNSQFTIALFGAFSAGKSSLANALLGASVLPVSPNPTTAAVNRIVPPTPERPSGTASVVMKSRAAMLEDLKYSLQLLGESVDGLQDKDVLARIGRLTPDGVHAGGRPHYSFLKAAAKGWAEHEALLGQHLAVDNSMYRRYVAEESRSCFVSEIVLHHANPLTAQGIVLVDTPGADSVNARHTGVAFNYIKNADAILFVTYYNHAFSQADRQFLEQLGRVKDQFELDKMFFIVNAADLAASEEELQGVMAHVERNLQQHSIRFPRMFPVSSLLALEGKQSGSERLIAQSGIQAFESSFFAFTRYDLGKLAVESAEEELKRSRRTIGQWVRAAQGDAAAREAEQQRLAQSAEAARQLAASPSISSSGNPQLEQELKELLFYVLQRVQFRFGDHYNYAFNPSSLQDDGRDMKKALWTSWLELQRLLQIELSQELQATSLRLDNALNKLAAKRYADTAAEIAKLLEGFEASSFKPIVIPTPEEQPEWRAERIDAKWLWSRFKTPRHFFEGEGKQQLRKAFDDELAKPLQDWIDRAGEAWSTRYALLWQEAVSHGMSALAKDADVFVQGKLRSLSGHADLQALQQLEAELAAI